MVQNDNPRALKKYYNDVAGELANLISGTFANQMQFLNHELRLSTAEVEEDPISLKTFYETSTSPSSPPSVFRYRPLL